MIMKKIERIIKIFYFILLFSFICAFILECEYAVGTNCRAIKLFLMIRPESKSNIVSAFNSLWSVAVTVTIFILEVSERYKYGLALKRIAFEALGKRSLCIVVAIFLILFPLFYFFMKFSWMMLGVWCLAVAFAIFIGTILFFTYMYKGEYIREVIRIKTHKQIVDFSKPMDKKKKKKDKKKVSEDNGNNQLHKMIDGLAICDILDHTDYGNMDETSGLIDLCKNIFRISGLWNKLYESTLENLMITTWVDHIIHSSQWHTEYDRQQNVSNLRSLWKGITDTVVINGNNSDKTVPMQNFDSDTIILSVCMQFLQPFVNENNEENDKILVRIWSEFGIYRRQVIIYLLLYTAYRSYRLGTDGFTWFLRKENTFRESMKGIMRGSFEWDEHLAVRYWIDWSRYDCRTDVDLMVFEQFSKDMTSLKEEKRYKVRTPILIRAVGGIET